jgi:hypothetical protein
MCFRRSRLNKTPDKDVEEILGSPQPMQTLFLRGSFTSHCGNVHVLSALDKHFSCIQHQHLQPSGSMQEQALRCRAKTK